MNEGVKNQGRVKEQTVLEAKRDAGNERETEKEYLTVAQLHKYETRTTITITTTTTATKRREKLKERRREQKELKAACGIQVQRRTDRKGVCNSHRCWTERESERKDACPRVLCLKKIKKRQASSLRRTKDMLVSQHSAAQTEEVKVKTYVDMPHLFSFVSLPLLFNLALSLSLSLIATEIGIPPPPCFVI